MAVPQSSSYLSFSRANSVLEAFRQPSFFNKFIFRTPCAPRYVGSCPGEMAALEKALAESAARAQFLDGYEFDVPEEDFRLMMSAREWPKKLVAVLEVHVAKIEEEHERFESALKARRADFLELLAK